MKPGYKQTEVGVIPEDWEVKTMDSLTSLMTNGFVGTATNAYVNGDDGVLYVQGYNVQENSFNLHGIKRVSKAFHARNRKSCLREGDLLTIQTGDIGVTTIVPSELVGANCHALVISRFNKRSSDPRFYCQYFNSERGRAKFKEIETGSTMKHLNVGDMKPLLVPSPPVEEQRAIAEALSDVDALLGALDRLIAKKRDLKQAAMQQLLTGQTRLPGFHGEWEVKGLLDLARIAQGQVDPRQEPYRSKYLVGPVHVESGTGKLLGLQTAAEQGAISGKYLFEPGDIVYGKINPYLKKAFLAEFEGLCSADMYPLRPIAGVSHGYLLAVILGREFTKYAESVSVRSGMPKINRDEMKGFLVSIPKSFEEQTAIAEVLSDMDAELAALEQRRDKTRALKQGMMQELLTGRTRLL